MNSLQPKWFVHADPERADFLLSPHELDELVTCSDNIWKDVFIACLGVGIPCAINALSELSAQNAQILKDAAQIAAQTAAGVTGQQPHGLTITPGLFANAVFGAVGVVLGIIFGIAWFRTKTSVATLVQRIRSKPKVELSVSVIDVGRLENADKQTHPVEVPPTEAAPQ